MPKPHPTLAVMPLATQVYELLLHRIASGELRPGHVLREQELSTELGVSRTPIREAILRLTEYGLVDSLGRSAQVRRMTEQDVRYLFQVRRALELEAIRLACGKLTADDFTRLDAADPGPNRATATFEEQCRRYDWELHRTIAEASGNPLLAQKIRKLHDRVQLVCKHSPERLEEHRQIVLALKAKDRRGARRAMLAHLTAAYRAQVKALRTATTDTPRADDRR
jgi:DNA-binding GntR family transcriptional regulator